jgi:hypothetical protein
MVLRKRESPLALPRQMRIGSFTFECFTDVGDESRSFKPPQVNGESCYFLSFNRNKKSLAIDIKTPEGKAIILEVILFFKKYIKIEF